jgi:AcrR family transcriptional regulator
VPYARLPDPRRTVGALLESSGFHPGRRARDQLRVITTASGLPDSRVEEVLARLDWLAPRAGGCAGSRSARASASGWPLPCWGIRMSCSWTSRPTASTRPSLRDHLITTAARLIDQRGSAGLSVRDIAGEARVADGVLYNYFEDKEDLLAHALLAHVGTVMTSAPRLPPAGTGTVQQNLQLFIDGGIAVLLRVLPAFAGLLSQPRVLLRFHAMVGGDAAFGGPAAAADASGAAGERPAAGGERPEGPGAGPRGLPDILTAYLRAEQRLGRLDAAADVDAAATLIVGAMHGQVLPRVLFSPPGAPVTIPAGLAGRLAGVVVGGIASAR